jgi:hypothetical protein
MWKAKIMYDSIKEKCIHLDQFFVMQGHFIKPHNPGERLVFIRMRTKHSFILVHASLLVGGWSSQLPRRQGSLMEITSSSVNVVTVRLLSPPVVEYLLTSAMKIFRLELLRFFL